MERANRMICGYCSKEQVFTLSLSVCLSFSVFFASCSRTLETNPVYCVEPTWPSLLGPATGRVEEVVGTELR